MWVPEPSASRKWQPTGQDVVRPGKKQHYRVRHPSKPLKRLNRCRIIDLRNRSYGLNLRLLTPQQELELITPQRESATIGSI
jgi:hypothetical protein